MYIRVMRSCIYVLGGHVYTCYEVMYIRIRRSCIYVLGGHVYTCHEVMYIRVMRSCIYVLGVSILYLLLLFFDLIFKLFPQYGYLFGFMFLYYVIS